MGESLHLFPQQAVLSPLPCKRTTLFIFRYHWLCSLNYLTNKKLLRWNRFSNCPDNNLWFGRGKQHIVPCVVILWWSSDRTFRSFSRCLQMFHKSRTAQHLSQFFSCSFSSRKRFQIKRLVEQRERIKKNKYIK